MRKSRGKEKRADLWCSIARALRWSGKSWPINRQPGQILCILLEVCTYCTLYERSILTTTLRVHHVCTVCGTYAHTSYESSKNVVLLCIARVCIIILLLQYAYSIITSRVVRAHYDYIYYYYAYYERS